MKTKKGKHYWALLDKKMVIVLKTKTGDFVVCGDWEGYFDE